MTVTTVNLRQTKAGQPWAILQGQWRGHRLRCLVFPNAWARVPQPLPGDAIVVRGKIAFRDGDAVIWALDLAKFSLA